MEADFLEYKKAIIYYQFDRCDTKGYYQDIIDSWRNNEFSLIENCPAKFKQLFTDFVFVLDDLARNIFELFSASLRIEADIRAKNTFGRKLTHVDDSFTELRAYGNVIIVNVQKQQDKEAKFLQISLLNYIDKFYSLLETIGINLDKSPLLRKLKKLRKYFEKINIPAQDNSFLEEKEKSTKINTPLEDFFLDKASPEKIKAIQEKFKGLKGKEMAILIYLLNKRYDLVSIDNTQKSKKSRIHFVRALTGKEIKEINGINNFFISITGETDVNKDDEAFLLIEKQLKEMVSNG